MGGGEVLRISAFARFWVADTVSALGTTVSTVAIQVLVVTVLGAGAAEVGVVNAAQLAPYAIVGLLAGVLVDRWSRRWTLVWANLGRAALLVLVPVLWSAGALSLGAVATVLFAFGVLAVFGAAAEQSLLPLLVPRNALVAANARIGQSAAVAQTSGPALGGALVAWVGAPFAVLVDAATYVASAALLASLPVVEDRAAPRTARRPTIRRDVAEGLRWTYRHRTLAPLAVSTHVWFVAQAAALTVLAPFALRELTFSPLVYGVVLALAGVGWFLGALLAPRAGQRLGEGRAVLVGRLVTPLGWAVVAVVPTGTWAVLLVAAALCVTGFGIGLEDPNEVGYRQAVTPDELQGRMNATMRSANRTMAVVGSLVGGVLADRVGSRPTLWLSVVVMLVAATVIAFSPFRGARHDDPAPHGRRGD